jgi:glycosyltransferase involved in cell wall biosynthesis
VSGSPSVAIALVTHNAERWIDPLLRSILGQTRQPDSIVIVDDHSMDRTRGIIADILGDRVEVIPATSTASRSFDRISQNFVQGVRASQGHDVVVLGDHDDVWLHDRIAHQVGLLTADAGRPALMVASDGRLVDGAGQPIGGTLRSVFPGPPHDACVDPRALLRFTLAHSVATGGASAIRPLEFPDLSVPPGWLHDRWWSLVAAARAGLRIDDQVVIDYRVQQGQEVGLELGSQGLGGLSKARALGVAGSVRKLIAIRRHLLPLADDAGLRRELTLSSLLGTYSSKGS